MSIQETVFLTFLPPANELWGKVMFSHAFVCPRGVSASGSRGVYSGSGGGGVVPMGLGCTSWSGGRGVHTPLDTPGSSSGRYTS